jgi:hypothetical protein
VSPGPLRIESSNRAGGVQGRSGVNKTAGGPAFVPAGEGTASQVASTAPTASLTGLDAILALQTVGDFTESRKKAVKRGTAMLDLLEGIKADLLIGDVSPERLNAMMSELATSRESIEPGLDHLLDDIELRVRVELAKRGHFPAF